MDTASKYQPLEGTNKNVIINPYRYSAGGGGVFGNASRYFDGTDQITFSPSATLRDLPTTHDFMLAFWAKPDGASTADAGVSWNGTDDLILYPNDSAAGSGGPRLFWRRKGGNQISISGANTAGVWHHYAYISRAVDDHELYVDGVSVATSSANPAASGPFTGFAVGSFEGGQKFAGYLADVRVYDSASAASPASLAAGTDQPTNLIGWWLINSDDVTDHAGSNDGTDSGTAYSTDGPLD